VILPALGRGRCVVTNLPLRVEVIRQRFPSLTVFHDPSMSCSDFVRWGKDSDNPVPDLMVLTAEQVSLFYRISPSNSIIVLDELYQFLGAKCDIPKPQQKQLLAYFRQHRHYRDDIFLISHNAADIVVDCRRSIMQEWRCRNSRKRMIVNSGPLARLFAFTWPFQFFMIDEYIEGDKSPQCSRNIFPSADVFAVYDSYALADDISGKQLSSGGHSSDTGFRFWPWWWDGFARSSLAWCALVVLLVIAWKLYDVTVGDFKRKAEAKRIAKLGRKLTVPVPVVPADFSNSVLSEELSDVLPVPSDPVSAADPVELWTITYASSSGVCWRRGDSSGVWRVGDCFEGQRLVNYGSRLGVVACGGCGVCGGSGG